MEYGQIKTKSAKKMKTKESIKNLKEFSLVNSVMLCCSNNTSWRVYSPQCILHSKVHRLSFSIWVSLAPSSGLLYRVSAVEWVSSCSSVSFVCHPCRCGDVLFTFLCCMCVSIDLLLSMSLLRLVSWISLCCWWLSLEPLSLPLDRPLDVFLCLLMS